MKLIILLVFLLVTVAVRANDAIVGVWENSSSKALIEIYKINNKFFGKLISLPRPVDANGNLKLDKKNPNKNLQNNPLVGLVILKDLTYNQDDNQWKQGKFYNPDDGNSYSCFIKMADKNTLNVRGYIGFSLFGKSCVLKRIR